MEKVVGATLIRRRRRRRVAPGRRRSRRPERPPDGGGGGDRSGSRPIEEVAGPGGHGQGELEEMASRPHRPWRPLPMLCSAMRRLGREEKGN
jgi:hypothetical protein